MLHHHQLDTQIEGIPTTQSTRCYGRWFFLKAPSRTEKEQSTVSPPCFSVYSWHRARPATFQAKPHLLTSLRDIACSYTTWYTAQASLKRSMRSLGLYSNSSALYSICTIPQAKKKPCLFLGQPLELSMYSIQQKDTYPLVLLVEFTEIDVPLCFVLQLTKFRALPQVLLIKRCPTALVIFRYCYLGEALQGHYL